MKLQAKAKINLSLDVLGEREDGYHELRTVMAGVRNLYDTVFMEEASAVTVGCTEKLPEDNTAFRAASLFSYRFGCGGARIHIEKSIPSQAGLGGASADAAAVLRGMQQLYGYPASEDQLYALAAEIGADVPFCLHGGVCLCEGIGERIKQLDVSLGIPIVLLKCEAGVSTAALFRSLKPRPQHKLFHSLRVPIMRRETVLLLSSLRKRDISGIAEGLHNDLLAPAATLLPEIGENIERLLALGAVGAGMSGSGSCVFGIFTSAGAAQSAYMSLSDTAFAFCGEI